MAAPSPSPAPAIHCAGRLRQERRRFNAWPPGANARQNVINLLKAPPPPDPRQILLQVKFAAVDRTALTQVVFNLFSLNGKMIGGTGTEQFHTAALHRHIRQRSFHQHGQFFRSLNLFAFRPISTSAPPSKRCRSTTCFRSWLNEPDLRGRQGRQLPGGGSFPSRPLPPPPPAAPPRP